MLTNFKRIYHFATVDLMRNKGIAVAAIFVVVMAMLVATGIFFFQGISRYLISQIQDKIDVTAYFKEDALEDDILTVKDEISKMSLNIADVEYVSKEEALERFLARHQGNDVYARALQEVGGNPFLPSLNIKTNGDTSQYEEIANLLQTAEFSKFIDSVDFFQKKDTIEKVFSLTSNVNRAAIILGVILVLVAILVVFNTIKLAVENSKEEINTMRIVGATDWFVRGPFIVQGAIYGIAAFVICFLLTGIFSYLIASKVELIMPGFNIFSFFLRNFFLIILIQLGFGILLGVASSYIVVRRYLKN